MGRSNYFTISACHCSGRFQSEIDIQIPKYSLSTQPNDNQQCKGVECRRVSSIVSPQLYGLFVHGMYNSGRSIHTRVPFQFGEPKLRISTMPGHFQCT